MIQDRGLLVIDPQDEFIKRSSLTQDMGSRLCDLLDGAIFPSTAVTRFRNALDSPHQTILGWNRMISPEECHLWKPIQERVNADQVIDKHSYTSATPEVLRALRRGDTLFLAGLDTDCCVLATAVDLFQRSIRPIVLADFCFSSGGERAHEAGLECLQRLIGPKNIVRNTPTTSQLRERLTRENLLSGEAEGPGKGGYARGTRSLESLYKEIPLKLVLRNIWHDLSSGATDLTHRFHTMTLATKGVSGHPTQRSVLLRECSPEDGVLTFYTDGRSSKVRDIIRNPFVTLCFYDPATGVQIATAGSAILHNKNNSSLRILSELPKRELTHYLAEMPPGTPQTSPTTGLPRDLRSATLGDEHIRRASENFTVVEVTLEKLDWFITQGDSCLRAQFHREGKAWSGTWVTP